MKKQTVVGGALVIAAAASLWQTSATADTLWAEKSGWIKLVGYGQLQHTYACYSKPGVTRACYANPGSSSGGSYLSRTIGSGTGSKLTCAKGGSCAISWGLTGTCHQGANRMLKTAGKQSPRQVATPSRCGCSGLTVQPRLGKNAGAHAASERFLIERLCGRPPRRAVARWRLGFMRTRSLIGAAATAVVVVTAVVFWLARLPLLVPEQVTNRSVNNTDGEHAAYSTPIRPPIPRAFGH